MLQELEIILSEVEEYEEDHHMNRPFYSAYQLAIAFAERNPNHDSVQSLPIGGTGTQEHQSLAQLIARTLSKAIRSGSINTIEGGFISHTNLERMQFSGDINVSTLTTKPGHSIFRYIG